jgi:hypothetical protein
MTSRWTTADSDGLAPSFHLLENLRFKVAARQWYRALVRVF